MLAKYGRPVGDAEDTAEMLEQFLEEKTPPDPDDEVAGPRLDAGPERVKP